MTYGFGSFGSWSLGLLSFRPMLGQKIIARRMPHGSSHLMAKKQKEEEARVPVSPRRAYPKWCNFLQVDPVAQEFHCLVRCDSVCLQFPRVERLTDLRPYHSLSLVGTSDWAMMT